MYLLALFLLVSGIASSMDGFVMGLGGTALVTNEVYFQISIGGKMRGTITFGLFGDLAPRTVENFLHYATQGKIGEGYKGSIIHRVVKGHVFQGGDFINGDGTGETSKFGQPHFEDESFVLRHNGAGWLGMANRGPDTNSCQFFVTFDDAPWLDHKHVIFGKVLKGMDVVNAIENVSTDEDDIPKEVVKIIKCGENNVRTPYRVATKAGSDEL